jgi:alcohol dehydrogenase
MWQRFTVNTPQIRFGVDSVNSLGSQLQRLGASRVLVISGPFVKKTEAWQRVQAALGNHKIAYESLIPPRSQLEPTSRDTDATAQIIKEGKFDAIVGLGGGSVMDTAKMAAALVSNPGQTREFFHEKKLRKRDLPMIMIPTTSGTSSEITPYSVLVDESDGLKKSAVALALLPDVAIIDPRLTLSAPPSLTAATGMDAFIHALEAYTAKTANPLCDIMALESMALINRWLGPAVADGSNLEARCHMSLASVYAGMGLCNVGTHVIHSLGEIYSAQENVSHGDSLCAILLACVDSMTVALPEKIWRLGQTLGENMEGISWAKGSKITLQALAWLLRSVKLPSTLPEAGISDSSKIAAWAEAGYEDLQRLQTAPRDYTAQDLIDILTRSFAAGGRQ